MGNWLWVLTGILLCIIFILLFKLFMLKKNGRGNTESVCRKTQDRNQYSHKHIP